jgi:hypothetical protein
LGFTVSSDWAFCTGHWASQSHRIGHSVPGPKFRIQVLAGNTSSGVSESAFSNHFLGIWFRTLGFHLVEHVREEQDEAVADGGNISVLVPNLPFALVDSKRPSVGWLPTSVHVVDRRYPP